MANHNKLLGRVHGVDGIKTGYTNASGFNLLTSARRGERHVVAVVMGGRSGGARDARMRQLIEQHFIEASAGPRTAALITEKANSETRKTIVAKAQVPVPSRSKADDAEITTSSSASAAPAGSTAKGVASSGAAASAPVMAMVPATQPASAPMILRPETAKPAVTASLVPSNGNPNPSPGVLGTLSSNHSVPDRTGTIAVARSAPAAPQPEPAKIKPKGEWSVQIGAYPTEGAAKESLAQARVSVGKTMASAQDYIEKVQKGSTQLVRARFAGFDRDGADAACKMLKKKDFSCMPIRN